MAMNRGAEDNKVIEAKQAIANKLPRAGCRAIQGRESLRAEALS